jgi:hypothetical protein
MSLVTSLVAVSLICLMMIVGTQGKTHGSTLQKCTNKTLTTDPFKKTYEADDVSPEVEVGGVGGLKCLQPSWDTDLSS